MVSRSRLKPQSQQPELANLVLQLRTVAGQYVQIGRQLRLMADRIERGDGLQPVPLGEITEALIARIMRGEGDDAS